MSSQISPQELAEMLIDKVTYYCSEISGDSYINCLFSHSPGDLDIFIDSYIDDEDINEALENTDNTFWEEVKKEYEKLWMPELARRVAEDLTDIIKGGRISIIEDNYLNDYEKTYVIKKYKDTLEELLNAIVKALNTQKPLSGDKLREYLLKLYIIAGLKYIYPDDTLDDYIDYYNYLNKAGKLDVLEIFSDGISNVLYDIDQDLKEYNSLEQ